MTEIFENLKFSFYVYWKCDDVSDSRLEENRLHDYFGKSRVVYCKNRVDSRVIECDSSVLRDICELNELDDADKWIQVENLFGTLINQIEPYVFLFYLF